VILHYDENCMSRKKVYELVEKLEARRTSVDDPHSQSPTETCVEVKEHTSIIVSGTTEGLALIKISCEMGFSCGKSCPKNTTKNTLF